MLKISFKDKSTYTGTSIYANNVFVGVLNPMACNSISWYSGANPCVLKYSLSDLSKFKVILNAIKDYCSSQNFTSLIIGNTNDDIGTFYDTKFWQYYGFELSENCMYYTMKI